MSYNLFSTVTTKTYNYYYDYTGICLHRTPEKPVPVPYWINPYNCIMIDNCPEWYLNELHREGFKKQ